MMLLKHSIGVLRPLWVAGHVADQHGWMNYRPWLPRPGDTVSKIVNDGYDVGPFGMIVGIKVVDVVGRDVLFAYVLWSDEYVVEQEFNVHDYYLKVKG